MLPSIPPARRKPAWAKRLGCAAALLVILLALLAPAPARAQSSGLKAFINLLTVPPELVCVGDTIRFMGAVDFESPEPEAPPPGYPPIAPLEFSTVSFEAKLGKVSPDRVEMPSLGYYFYFDYTATQPGEETVKAIAGADLAESTITFEVRDHCDYDVILTTVIDLQVDMDGEIMEYLTTVTGEGELLRDRDGGDTFSGGGDWFFEENMLTKPSMCVEWVFPPLVLDGPFQLDANLLAGGDELVVNLHFLPGNTPTRHGDVICVDQDGEEGRGWGFVQGGDPSKSASIVDSFPLDGGSRPVDPQGSGREIAESVGTLDIGGILTLLPR